MRLTRHNHSRMLLIWFLSYLFILIIPLSIGEVISDNAYRTINEEIQKVSEVSLQQLQSVTDGAFSAFDRIAGSLSLNNDVKLILSAKTAITGKQMMTLLRVQDTLAGYMLTDSLIDDILLYLPNQSCFLSSRYKYNVTDNDSFCRTKFGISFETFENLRPSKTQDRFRVFGEDESQKKAIYLNAIYTNGYSRPSGVLAICVNTARLRELIGNINTLHGADICIVNAREEYIGSGYDLLKAGNRNFAAIAGTGTTQDMTLNDREYTVSHVRSDVFDMQFVSLTPTAFYRTRADEIRKISRIYLIVCLVIGMILAALFAKRNYDPVLRLKKLLQSRNRGNGNESNEYRMIESSIGELLASENAMKELSEKQKEAQRNNLLGRVLLGRDPFDERMAGMLSEHGIRFIHDEYVVVSLIPSDNDPEASLPILREAESADLFSKAVGRIGSGVFGNHFTTAMTECNGSYVFIINTNHTGPEIIRDPIKEDTLLICDFVRSRFGLKLSADISSIHTGHYGIANGYSDTLLAREYRRFNRETEDIVFFDAIDHPDPERNFTGDGLSEQSRFRSYLEAGDFQGAAQIARNLLSQNPDSIYAMQLLTTRVIGMAGILIQYSASSSAGEDDESQKEHMRIFRKLTRAQSISELNGHFMELLERTSKTAVRHQDEKKPECVRQAEDYVDQHYMDKDLNVSVIADRLGFSVPYLSRTFKKNRNTGLLDYIHMKRLSIAKEYMNTMSISEVAEKTGYYDSKALISAFKRYEGITPGRFRAEILRQNEDGVRGK